MQTARLLTGAAGVLVVALVATVAEAGETTKVITHEDDGDTTVVIIEKTPTNDKECMEAIRRVEDEIGAHGQAELARADIENAREHCEDGEYEAAERDLTDALKQLKSRQR